MFGFHLLSKINLAPILLSAESEVLDTWCETTSVVSNQQSAARAQMRAVEFCFFVFKKFLLRKLKGYRAIKKLLAN